MTFEGVVEHELSDDLHHQISNLLTDSFEGYPTNRIYFQQLPGWRFLGKEASQVLLHTAVDDRMLNVGGQLVRTWALTDFCVHRDHRNKGLGKQAIKQLKKMAKQAGVQFLILTSQSSTFYDKLNFERKDVRARWVAIQDQQLFGVIERTIKDTLYVLPISKNKWPEGTVDFLGTMI